MQCLIVLGIAPIPLRDKSMSTSDLPGKVVKSSNPLGFGFGRGREARERGEREKRVRVLCPPWRRIQQAI